MQDFGVRICGPCWTPPSKLNLVVVGWRNDNGTAPAGSNPPEPNCIPYVRGERSSKKVVRWRLKPATRSGWLCATITAGIGVNRCQFESGRGRYAHQSRLAKSSGAASRRRTIWKCGTRRPRLSATKGHAPEDACTCAGAFHAAFSVTPARIAVRGAGCRNTGNTGFERLLLPRPECYRCATPSDKSAGRTPVEAPVVVATTDHPQVEYY